MAYANYSNLEEALNRTKSYTDKTNISTKGGTINGNVDVNGDVNVKNQFIIPDKHSNNRGCGIYETKDLTNLFGFLASDTSHATLNVGAKNKKLSFRGNGTRPLYNDKEISLQSDYDTLNGQVTLLTQTAGTLTSKVATLETGKQSVLSETQMKAVNSGITADILKSLQSNSGGGGSYVPISATNGASTMAQITGNISNVGNITLSSQSTSSTMSLKIAPTYVSINGNDVATKKDVPQWFSTNYVSYSAIGVGSKVTIDWSYLTDLSTGVTGWSGVRIANPKVNDYVIFSKTPGVVIGRIVSVSENPILNGTDIGVEVTFAKIDGFTCLEQGTMIAMADGTQKPIEEIRNGDLLLSYDFEKKKQTTAVCMLATQTRSDYHANYIAFDNDIVLGIDVENSHEVYNVTKGCFTSCKHELDVGDYGLDINGNEVEFIGPMDWISDGKLKGFYNIVSSNNCYYANNLLIAHDPFCKKSWVERYSKEEIPDELKELIELDSMETKKKNYLVENKDVMYKLIKVYSKIEKCFVQLGAIKNKLTATDYVSNKASEGYESEKINTILEERKQLRLDYNRIEAEKIELEKEYDDLRVKYSPLGKDVLLSEFELRSKLFHEACKRDNEAFETFKKCFGANK